MYGGVLVGCVVDWYVVVVFFDEVEYYVEFEFGVFVVWFGCEEGFEDVFEYVGCYVDICVGDFECYVFVGWYWCVVCVGCGVGLCVVVCGDC